VAEQEPRWEWLASEFPSFPEPERWIPLLQRHAAILDASPIRATAVDSSRMVRRHFAESLELLRIALEGGFEPPAVDVGSGAGFPGLVIAAVFPDWEVHLIEPQRKRARLLAEIARCLELPNVVVHAVRAEEAGRGSLRERAKGVTARAVAPLPELLEYTAPLAAVGAPLVLPKGSRFREELEGSARALRQLGVAYEGAIPMRPQISETIVVLRFRKIEPTPQRYPRRPGLPAKRPL